MLSNQSNPNRWRWTVVERQKKKNSEFLFLGKAEPTKPSEPSEDPSNTGTSNSDSDPKKPKKGEDAGAKKKPQWFEEDQVPNSSFNDVRLWRFKNKINLLKTFAYDVLKTKLNINL